MQNLEIKLRIADPDKARAQLKELGAQLQWTRRQRDVFYPAPNGWLKLRFEWQGRNSLMSYRRVPDGTSMRNDYSFVDVEDPDALHATLAHALGTEGEVEKERTLWVWRHTRVHLDNVQRLGWFLELETVLAEIGSELGKAEFAELMQRLRLDPETRLEVPYRDLLRK